MSPMSKGGTKAGSLSRPPWTGTESWRAGSRLANAPSVLFVALGAGTLMILITPSLAFSWHAPGLALPLEALMVFATTAAAAVAYLRYETEWRRSWLMISGAFLVIAMSRVLFGASVRLGGGSDQTAALLWMAAYIYAGIVLSVAAFGSDEAEPELSHPAAVVLKIAGGGALVLGGLWLLRGFLPALVDPGTRFVSSRFLTGYEPGVTLASLVIGVVGVIVFLAAAIGLVGETHAPNSARRWLAAALVFAAVAHVHHALVPTPLADDVTTGDLLRLAMSLVLLVALSIDIRRTYLQERQRSYELETAFQHEQQRVKHLESLERTKADLLRVITHEVLHPVAAIRAMALGLDRGSADLTETQRRSVEGILHQSAQLRDMIEGSTDILKIGSGSIGIAAESWEVDAVLPRVQRTFAHLSHRMRVEVQPSSEARVDIDVTRIMQVFHNLLSNAARFSVPNSPIVLRSHVSGHACRLEVEDAGTGIPIDRVDSLFSAEPRNARRRDGEGMGVGLYVSRLIVEAHGGRIWTDPSFESGCRMVFELPLAES